MSSDAIQLGACYGRYREWKSVASAATEVSDPTSEQPPLVAVVVQFEATAREDFRVGFAANPASTSTLTTEMQSDRAVHLNWLYEIAIGSSGNTDVVWRKNVGKSGSAVKEIELAKIFAGRTCSPQEFVPYWVVIQSGALIFGIGKTVGEDTVAKCVDSMFTPVDHVAFTTWDAPAHYRNIVFAPVYDQPLPVDNMIPRVIVRADPFGNQDLLTAVQRSEYEKEFALAKRRSERFGGAFQPPDIRKYMDPKEIRKLQRTGAITQGTGFTTGFDMTSQEETAKRQERMKRFNTPQFAVDFSIETSRALAEGMTQEEWQEKQREKEKLRERAIKFGLSTANDVEEGITKKELRAASAKVRKERCDIRDDAMIEYREDAIHVYSLDERFQQVRTSDIMGYFLGYGPSYVEWINDSSCTVIFDDPFTAGRALIALSQAIPPQTIKKKKETITESTTISEPNTQVGDAGAEDVDMEDAEAEEESGDADAMDGIVKANATSTEVAVAEEEVPDEAFNRSQWRFGLPIGSNSQPKYKKWRLLLRKATVDDFPPEKTQKKYHERSQRLQQRGRGHRQDRYESSSRREGRARAHPYRNNSSSGSRNRRREMSGDQFDGNSPPRDTGKPSTRFQMNDDGSINFVRAKDEEGAASGRDSVADPVNTEESTSAMKAEESL